MRPRTLETSLREAQILVCAGTGGVGKTTIAAALGIQAALLGRRTLVLTIDPAKRLADALGVDALGAQPTQIDLRSEGVPQPAATLHAMMLDAKPTFDRVVSRLTPDQQERQRIFDNRIYQHLSSAFAGSVEYAAMEQVYELVQSDEYDLIVVDTPPADHALDFLRAPQRLRDFLTGRFVRVLVLPTLSASRIGLRFFERPLHHMLGLLERLAGAEFLDDLRNFLRAIDGFSQGFSERATRVEGLLLGEETRFILVTSAIGRSELSTLEFMDALEKFQVPLAAIVINRVQTWPLDLKPAELHKRCGREAIERDHARLDQAFAPRPGNPRDREIRLSDWHDLSDAILDHAEICSREVETVEMMTAMATRSGLACHCVPELANELGRIDGLLEIGSILTRAAKHEDSTDHLDRVKTARDDAS
jgi:anion-transporting  ArsA/GET3 family ATPase